MAGDGAWPGGRFLLFGAARDEHGAGGDYEEFLHS